MIDEENEKDRLKLIDQLCKYIYGLQGDEYDRLRTRALLCHVYHYAFCDKSVAELGVNASLCPLEER